MIRGSRICVGRVHADLHVSRSKFKERLKLISEWNRSPGLADRRKFRKVRLRSGNPYVDRC